MAVTNWTNEFIPGTTWLAGAADITAGADLYDGMVVYAGSIGLTTNWTLEDK